ncbi:MAG: CRISPR-associated endonuclease Cas3'' [Nitrososphaerota archaeon]
MEKMSEKWQIFSEFTKFSNLLSYAEFKEGQAIVETFIEHAFLSMKHWILLKKRILHALSRVIDKPMEDVERGVSFTILLHDVGKLTTAYQDYLRKRKLGMEAKVGFNHEIASIPVILNYAEQVGIDNELSRIVAGAVLFHHEALRPHNQRLIINNLISPLHNKYPNGVVRFAPSSNELVQQLLLKFDLLKSHEELPILDFSIDSLKVKLVELFYAYNPENPVNLHIVRLRVSAIQQILSVCDNRAASECRPKKDSPFIRELLEGGWKIWS